MAIERFKRPLDRGNGEFRDASLFIVATEGECTEPQYLGMFKSPRIKIIPIPPKDHRSAPKWVLEELHKFVKKHQFGSDDTAWLMIDKDRWNERSLIEVSQTCAQCGYNLVISNPRFEVWLAMHFDDALPQSPNKGVLERHLREILGSYSKSKLQMEHYMGREQSACERGAANDAANALPWPDAPNSRVYQLIEDILSKI